MSAPIRRASGMGIYVIVPTLAALLAAVLENLSFGLSNLPDAAPFLSLIVVFFWTSRRPDALPPLVVFLIGIWHDSLAGTPIGMSSFILLGARIAVTEQNVFNFAQSFIMGWMGFTIVCLIAVLAKWLIASWMLEEVLSIGTFAVQWGLTIVFYPLVGALCGWVDQWIFFGRRG